MNEFLIDLQEYQLLAVIISALAYAVFFGIRNTFVLTVVLYIGICALHQAMQDSLWQAGVMAWYSVYAITDFIYVYVVFFLHDALKIKFCKLSSFILCGFIFLGFFQISRYLDRVAFKTDYLSDMYTPVILSVNMTNTIAISLFAGVSIIYTITKHFKGKF